MPSNYIKKELTPEEILELRRSLAPYSDHDEGFERLYREAYRLACTLNKDIPFLEIGNRIGGSAMLIMTAIRNSGIRRPFITVDRHGTEVINDYEIEKYYFDFMYNVANFAYKDKINWIHFRMPSIDFLKIYELLDFYKNHQRFGFVYLDGDHHPDVVDKELIFFEPRMVQNGLLVVDDVPVNYGYCDWIYRTYCDFVRKCTWYDNQNIAYLQF